MATILGYDIKGGSSAGIGGAGKVLGKYTLAAAQTLTEMHGWFNGSGSSSNIILELYIDAAGVPTTRVAYSSPIAVPTGDSELSQTGFSVALSPGDYWIGAGCDVGGPSAYFETTGGSSKRWTSGTTFNPPASPCETVGVTNQARKYSFWAVAGAAPVAFVPQIVIV